MVSPSTLGLIMKKPLLEIYALAVCFVALMCFVIALGIGVYDLIQLANPGFTINAYEYDRHQSNEAFRRGGMVGPGHLTYSGGATGGVVIEPRIPIEPTTPAVEEAVTRQREESYQAALRSERRRGMQGFLQVVIILVIDVLVFVPHWFLARRIRDASMVS